MRKRSTRWGTLPYLIDGAHRITQSNAILRYIARKHNLYGETEEEKIRVDILENQLMDTRMQLATVCYSPDFEKLKPEYVEGLPEKMKLFSQFLGKRPWFAGDKITFVDFLAYDILDQNRMFEPKCLDAFPNLKDFMSHFEIQSERGSQRRMSLTWNRRLQWESTRHMCIFKKHRAKGFKGEVMAKYLIVLG
ncbi:glutathione S-transferase Mu 2-like isoform X3 [Cynocephalus volans]|uniref:glutathione S-transferase Mu 2-like isoform X3 n=1 Tax=Cynocephalus volans TaxID=110931 RepID=UPI002FC7CAD5